MEWTEHGPRSVRVGPLFGTDGIRGTTEYSAGPDRGLKLTPELALRIGHAAGRFLQTQFPAHERGFVLIGRDSRISGMMLESAVTAGLLAQGVDVVRVGMIPTPAIALLTRQLGGRMGIVISASHNPVVDNGIKFFDHQGYKLTAEWEQQIETFVTAPTLSRRDTRHLGRLEPGEDRQQWYADYLVQSWRGQRDLSGQRVLLECTNGATSRIAPQVFRRLGAEVQVLNGQPDGLNINESYEYISPQRFARHVLETGANMGVAFDGDGDRAILVDEKGGVVDGDVVLAILARYLLAQNSLPHHTIVATNMSNYGLHDSLREVSVRVVETGVGDRFVLRRMLADGYTLGGERSGHILILDRDHVTGDGIYTALTVAAAMTDRDAKLSALASVMTRYPQFIDSAAVPPAKPPLERIDQVQAIIARLQSRLGEQAEINLRYSGTEDKLRLAVRSRDHDDPRRIAREAREALRQTVQAIAAFAAATT